MKYLATTELLHMTLKGKLLAYLCRGNMVMLRLFFGFYEHGDI